jgi:hypothetical protein
MNRSTTYKIANFIGFQAGWFASILGAAAGLPWLGPVCVLVLVIGNMLVRRRWAADAALYLTAGMLGYAGDSALVLSGLMGFPERAAFGQPSTIWMSFMWMNFAATLHASLAWLKGRYVLTAVFGLIGGPLAYWAGERFGAVTLADWLALGAVGIEWLLATPLLVWIAQTSDRFSSPVTKTRTTTSSEGVA